MDAGLQFADSYLGFLYGGVPADQVSPVTPSLRLELIRGHAIVTPAERQRQVVVRGLVLISKSTGTDVADARVDDGASPPYVLTFNLRLREGRWVVERIVGSAAGGSGQ